MQYADAVQVIRHTPILARLDPAMQKLLAFSSSYLVFHPGESLCREGEPSDGAYVIDEGEVEIVISVGPAEVVLGRQGKHQLFGEMGIFCNKPRSADVRAVGIVKVLKIESDVFLRAVTSNADAALAVMRILSEKLAAMTEVYRSGPRWPGGPATDAAGGAGA